MSQEKITRYAPYIETKHKAFLNDIQSKRISVSNESPFEDYDDVPIDDAFFGVGLLINDLPSLYDMFGKFVAGLDIDTLYDQMVESTINGVVAKTIISNVNNTLQTDINANSIQRLNAGCTDINSIMGDVFLDGEEVIENTRLKLNTKFEKQLKYSLLPVAQARWATHLDWNKTVVSYYSEVMGLYFSAKMDVEDANYAAAAKHALWPFTVLDFEKAALGALQGATTRIQKDGVAGTSTFQKVVAGALGGLSGGAQIGARVNPPTAATSTTEASSGGTNWGAGIGAVLGGLSGAL
jgi:hypothetical protein